MQLTLILNGKVTELVLCEDCARKKGLFDPQSLSFAEQFFPEEFKKKVENLVKELAGNPVQQEELPHELTMGSDALTRCPVCDFSLQTYRKTGRFGCPDCYNVFAEELRMEQIEDETAPVVADESPALTRKKLEQQLQAAIEQEDYEHAAKLRDMLKELN